MGFAVLGIALGLLAQDSLLEKVATGHLYADSPLWSKSVGGMLFCEIPSNRILAFQPGKGVGMYREKMGGPSGIDLDSEGRLVVAEQRTRRLIRLYPDKDGKMDVLAERFAGKRFNAPNDVVVRKDGHIYFTDPAFGSQADHRELDFDGVFHLTPKGELELVAKVKGRPNGITLSPNGKTLYVSSADERRIYAWDVDGRGRATNERVFLDNIDGPPAGMTVDEKGNLYYAANKIFIVNPQGQPVDAVIIPDRPTNVAFGDEDGMTLYISAKSGMYRARMKVKGAVSE
jgi:gluconolactonase